MKNNNDKTWIIVFIAVLAFFLIGSFGGNMMGFGNNGFCGMMGGFYGSNGMNAFSWFFMILIIIAIILLIIWLIKQIQNK